MARHNGQGKQDRPKWLVLRIRVPMGSLECWEGGVLQHEFSCTVASLDDDFPRTGYRVAEKYDRVGVSALYEVANEQRPVVSAEIGPAVIVINGSGEFFTLCSVSISAELYEGAETMKWMHEMASEGIVFLTGEDAETLFRWAPVGTELKVCQEP